MLKLVLLCVLVPHWSAQQCLTPRDEMREVKPEALHSLLAGELQFSADMVRTVSALQEGQNMFFSPTSVFRAMLLGYFVAANHTEASLKKTLHLDDNLDKLDYMGAYSLDSYYQKLRSIQKGGCQMSLSNRIYVAKQLKVQHCLRVLFTDELQSVNFRASCSRVRKQINQWVSDQTNKLIKDFLSEDSVSKNTELVLVNAAYFKGVWKTEFDQEFTQKGTFRLSNGTGVECPMMFQESEFKIQLNQDLNAQVLELPYKGGDISMFIMLPVKHSAEVLHSMLQNIDGPKLKNMVHAIHTDPAIYDMSVTIPKFTVEESLQLTPILEKMGVGDLFQSTADLSRLTGEKGLSFSDAIHKAKIKVDEKGTEAAAATAFVSARMGTPSFTANRPFAYTLYDKATDQALFFGVFNSPP